RLHMDPILRKSASYLVAWEDVGELLRAQPASIGSWVDRCPARRLGLCLAAIIVGGGIYGAVMGSWRSPLQAFYTGLKLPLVILLTTLGNALLNAMLAPLLGLNLSGRQCLMVILMTFAIAALLLGALSPIAAFVVWNTPALADSTRLSSPEY